MSQTEGRVRPIGGDVKEDEDEDDEEEDMNSEHDEPDERGESAMENEGRDWLPHVYAQLPRRGSSAHEQEKAPARVGAANHRGVHRTRSRVESMTPMTMYGEEEDKEEVVLIMTPLVCDVAVTTVLIHPHEPHVVFAGTLSGRILRWNLYASDWPTLAPRPLCGAALDSSGSPFVLRTPAQPPDFASFPSPRAHAGPVIRLALHGESDYYHLYSMSAEGTVCMWTTTSSTTGLSPWQNHKDDNYHNSQQQQQDHDKQMDMMGSRDGSPRRVGVGGASDDAFGRAHYASATMAYPSPSTPAAGSSASTRLMPSLPVTVRRAYWGNSALGYVAAAADFCPVRGTDAMGEVFVATMSGWLLHGTSSDAHLLELRQVADLVSQGAGGGGMQWADPTRHGVNLLLPLLILLLILLLHVMIRIATIWVMAQRRCRQGIVTRIMRTCTPPRCTHTVRQRRRLMSKSRTWTPHLRIAPLAWPRCRNILLPSCPLLLPLRRRPWQRQVHSFLPLHSPLS